MDTLIRGEMGGMAGRRSGGEGRGGRRVGKERRGREGGER